MIEAKVSNSLRVSAAALARIVVGEQLALALSKAQLRIGRRVFSPFGGAIATTSAGRSFLESSLGAVFEEEPKRSAGKDWIDLRLSLPEVNLDTFDDWFRQRVDREWGPEREVLEELVETGVLAEEEAEAERVFSAAPSYLGLRRCREASRRPERDGILTERYAEVFEVPLVPWIQERLLEKAARQETERTVLLRTEEEIRRGTDLAGNCVDLLPDFLTPQSAKR